MYSGISAFIYRILTTRLLDLIQLAQRVALSCRQDRSLNGHLLEFKEDPTCRRFYKIYFCAKSTKYLIQIIVAPGKNESDGEEELRLIV